MTTDICSRPKPASVLSPPGVSCLTVRYAPAGTLPDATNRPMVAVAPDATMTSVEVAPPCQVVLAAGNAPAGVTPQGSAWGASSPTVSLSGPTHVAHPEKL